MSILQTNWCRISSINRTHVCMGDAPPKFHVAMEQEFIAKGH